MKRTNVIRDLFFFRWTLKWIINNKKMLYYDRIDVFEGVDVTKTS